MFCALDGATFTPSLASHRQIPATTTPCRVRVRPGDEDAPFKAALAVRSHRRKPEEHPKARPRRAGYPGTIVVKLHSTRPPSPGASKAYHLCRPLVCRNGKQVRPSGRIRAGNPPPPPPGQATGKSNSPLAMSSMNSIASRSPTVANSIGHLSQRDVPFEGIPLHREPPSGPRPVRVYRTKDPVS